MVVGLGDSKIAQINKQLLQITHKQIKTLLDNKHHADPVAGIVIIGLNDIEVVSPQGQKYHFHGARVLAGSKDRPNFVNPHYHKKGEEPYSILSGEAGEINLGKVIGEKVLWEKPQVIQTGDFLEIQEEEVHSLRNVGTEPLDFVFACPDAHLVDNSVEHPEGDRYLTKDLVNGIPSHYPLNK